MRAPRSCNISPVCARANSTAAEVHTSQRTHALSTNAFPLEFFLWLALTSSWHVQTIRERCNADKDALMADIHRALTQQLLRHGLDPSTCLPANSEHQGSSADSLQLRWQLKACMAALAAVLACAAFVFVTWDWQLAAPPY